MARTKSPLPFAPWQPDQSMIGGTSAEAKGVIRLGGKYVPDLSFLPLRTGYAIGDRALGGAGFYEGGTTARLFVGDTSDLYEIVARAPVVKSKIGGYTANTDWAWSFEQYGEYVLAAGKDSGFIQKFLMGTDTVFSDLDTGPAESDGIFRVREFLFSGRGVHMSNSAFNNLLDWEPDSGTQAAEFDLPGDGGNFVRGVGGQFGIIFQERKVHRLTYAGGTDAPFQRDEIEDKRGAMGPNAVCRYGPMTFFVSEDGIRVTDGNQSQGIGEGKVDRYFASRLNYSARSRISMACDVEKRLLKIAFPASGSSRCNEILTYSMADGEWTHDDVSLDLLFEAPRPGIVIDDDEAIEAVAGSSVIDDVNIPVDSPVWRESRKQIMGVDYSGEVGTFEGPNRPGIMETGFAEVLPGRKGFVSEVWPLVDASTCAVSVTSKLSRLADQTVNGPLAQMNAFGCCPVMVEARWLRAQLQVPYGIPWTEASGIDHDASVSGEL